MRHRGIDEIAGRRVEHALGLSGRARRIEDEQRSLGLHFDGRAFAVDPFGGIMVIRVPAWHHGHLGPGARHDQNPFDDPGLHDRSVDVLFQRHRATAAQRLVGRDHEPRAASRDAARQGLGREPTEHHRVDRADAGTGQHGERGLRDHRHVDRDDVALADPLRLDDVREPADFGMELAVRDGALLAGIVSLPEYRDLVAPGGQVTVDAVHRHVRGAVVVPRDRHLARRERCRLNAAIGLEPVDPHAVLAPEPDRVLDGAGVHLGIATRPDQGTFRERFRHIVDVIGHGESSSTLASDGRPLRAFSDENAV